MAETELDEVAAAEGLTGDPYAGQTYEDAPAEPEPEAPAGDGEKIDGASLALMASQGVGAIGMVVCKRAGATPLEEDEKAKLGAAVAKILQVYGLDTIANPKVAAWAGLLFTLGEVIGNRRPIAYEANMPEEPAAPSPADEVEDGYPSHE